MNGLCLAARDFVVATLWACSMLLGAPQFNPVWPVPVNTQCPVRAPSLSV